MDPKKPDTTDDTSTSAPENTSIINESIARPDVSPVEASASQGEDSDRADDSHVMVTATPDTDTTTPAPTTMEAETGGVTGGQTVRPDSTAAETSPSSPLPEEPTMPAAAPPKPVEGSPFPSWNTPGKGKSPAMPASTINPKPKKKALIVGIIIGLAVLLLGAGAAAAYFGYYLPNQPDNILKKALVNSFSSNLAKSGYTDGEFSIKDAAGDTFSGAFNGGASVDGPIQLQAEFDAGVTKLKAELRSVDGKTMYIKVGGLEGLPELLAATGDETVQAFAPLIGTLNNQWFELNESFLKEMGSASFSTKLSEADRQKLGSAYQNHQFLNVKEKLADETIKGSSSHHFKVVVDKTALKAFLSDIKNAKLDSMPLTQDDIDAFSKTVSTVDFTKYPVDVWVSKDTKQLSQVAFSLTAEDTTLAVRMTFFDYGKPVQVTKPEGAKSLLELMSELIGAGPGQEALLLQDLQTNGISL
jgi:hypothetical protein